jgi:small nuclear ribonucleoprotein (snRNP)-like protein
VRAKRSRILSERISEKVIITLKDGTAFEGVLWDADDRLWVLRNSEAIGAAKGGGSLPLDGEVIVLSGEILHVQRA